MHPKNIVYATAVLLLIFSSVSFARSVTMNMQFNIGDNDIIYANSTEYQSPAHETFLNPLQPFISSENAGILTFFGFAGTFLSEISFNSLYYPYKFSITQDEGNNIFIVGLTSGSHNNMSSSASEGRIPSRTVSSLIRPQAQSYVPLFLQLQFDTFDIIGTLGPGTLRIMNIGKIRIPQILLQRT